MKIKVLCRIFLLLSLFVSAFFTTHLSAQEPSYEEMNRCEVNEFYRLSNLDIRRIVLEVLRNRSCSYSFSLYKLITCALHENCHGKQLSKDFSNASVFNLTNDGYNKEGHQVHKLTIRFSQILTNGGAPSGLISSDIGLTLNFRFIEIEREGITHYVIVDNKNKDLLRVIKEDNDINRTSESYTLKLPVITMGAKDDGLRLNLSILAGTDDKLNLQDADPGLIASTCTGLKDHGEICAVLTGSYSNQQDRGLPKNFEGEVFISFSTPL